MYLPRYTITNKILRNVGIIEAAKEVIDHAPLLPYYEKKFQTDAMVRAVHFGTHIEGNELNLQQAERVVMGQEEQVIARDRDVQEVINYRRAMELIGEYPTQSSKTTVDEDMVKKLHRIIADRILPGEKCGEYRTIQVVVKNSQTGEVSFRPPAAFAVHYQLKELLDFVNDANADVHSVIKAGIMHYEFVRIHPFIDGNGRVGRCLSTLVLFQENYDIRKFFSLEEYFDSDPSGYYQALQSVAFHDNDLTMWLEYFTEGMAIELSKIKEKVERISVDGHLRQKLGGAPLLLSERQLKIIEYIQQTGYLQNSGFKQIFPFVSEDTVLNELKSLIQHNLIKKQGSTKAAKYVMT